MFYCIELALSAVLPFAGSVRQSDFEHFGAQSSGLGFQPFIELSRITCYSTLGEMRLWGTIYLPHTQ
jgi:hypothetical protein